MPGLVPGIRVIASQRVGAKRRPMTGSAKQSILSSCGEMDCFVARAPRNDGLGCLKLHPSRATYSMSSLRTQGPIIPGSVVARRRPTASFTTSDTAYGSLRPQGRRGERMLFEICLKICASGKYSSCPALCRASTSLLQDVDGRDDAGHDD